MDTLRGIFGSFGRSEEESEPEIELHGEDDHETPDHPPSPVGQDERRMQVRAYNHWASLLGDSNFPAIADLEPESLPDFGPYSVLLDFTDGIDNPGVLFVGDKLARECGTDAEIAYLEDVPSLSLLSRITDHYMQILANQAPIGFEAEFVNQRDMTVLYRGILLPYSSDNETIDHIYGVINWKELADSSTADELLLEIDRALAGEGSGAEAVAPAAATALPDDEQDDGDDSVLDLGAIGVLAEEDEHSAIEDISTAIASDHTDTAEWDETADDELPLRFVQPVFADDDDEWTAEDYEQGDEEGEDHHMPSLMGISIDKGERRKPTAPLDLFDQQDAAEAETTATIHAIPTAYEPVPAEGPKVPLDMIPVRGALRALESEYGSAGEETRSDDADEDADEAADDEAAGDELMPVASDEALGLHDCLAQARALAEVALGREDRTRDALYRAVGKAYDVSLQAAAQPEEFAELLADAGLAAQERAPMVPVVKLVFGLQYDKTRVTEYATVLAHAHRIGVERGAVDSLLRTGEGGLKAIVQAERKLRREERGEPVADARSMQQTLVRKLRAMPARSLDDLRSEGPEFALVMVRRDEDGSIVVIEEVDEDVALLERIGRKLAA